MWQAGLALKVAEENRIGLAPPNYGAVYPCVQNILLACRAVGLGAALTTMHQVFEDELHQYLASPMNMVWWSLSPSVGPWASLDP